MNKGFEVIEACRLFNLPPDRIKVIIHPQSTIHSLVEFRDGSILAQLSVTDMRLPILYALTYPERLDSELKFDLNSLKKLDFEPPDLDKFPCLKLAYDAAEAGGAKTIALNAADEVAVAAFLDGVIGFEDIPRTIKRVLDETTAYRPESIRKVLQIDAQARALAAEVIGVQTPPSFERRGVHSASGQSD
jgi:1-deoxy-D-xylulose-5-phosphate reductoisomerase